MAIQKEALDMFKSYEIPVDPGNGRRLKKNPHNKYVYEDTGEEYTSEEKPKTIRRPVMIEQELMDKDNFPIQARTLGIKKYQNLITELREASNNAKSGVVNFVVGRETENADAILKAAFPPGSGVVYQGVDGYGINASSWGMDPGKCKAKLLQLLKGNVRAIDKKEFDFVKSLSNKINSGTVEPGKVKPADPLSLLDPSSRPAAPNAAPAARQTGTVAPAAQGQAATQSAVERGLARIEEMRTMIEVCRREAAGLDRFDRNSDKTDPKGLSPARKFETIVNLINKAQMEIAVQQSLLPTHEDWAGEYQYDGTGFLDYKGELISVYSRLRQLLEPKSEDIAEEGGNTGRKVTPEQLDAAAKRLYDKYKSEMITMLQSMKRNSRGDLVQSCDAVISILEKPYEQIRASKGALGQSIKNLGMKMNSQNKIMVINNVDESGLARPPKGADDDHRIFTLDPVLSDHFVAREQRNKRSIVVVSRVPIKFGFDGVEHVPQDPSVFLVDDEEGAALTAYFVEKCRGQINKLIKDAEKARASGKAIPEGKMPTSSLISVSYDDIKRIAQILCGKTQAQAIHFLNKLFRAVTDPSSGALSGKKLVKEANNRNNEQVRGGSSWTNSTGETKGIYRKEAKLTMDHYIHSRRTDWGTKVQKVNDVVKRAAGKRMLQENIREKLQRIEDGLENAPQADVYALRKRADNLEKEAQSTFKGIKHFMILYGAAGCGKSAYPEALANQLGYDLLDVDFGQARGSLVGQTETWSRALIESWKKMSNVVIRMDEMDGQVVSEEAEGRESFNADVMKNLLSFFQDYEPLLEERNIFVVATTNNLDRIRKALRDRASLHLVPEPFDQEGYTSYLEHVVAILKTSHSMGFVYDPDSQTRSKDYWPETEALLNTVKPEFPRMAASLVNTGLNFRRLGQFIAELLSEHMRFIESTRMVRLYNEDRQKFIEEYPSECTKDPKTGAIACHQAKIEGIPFTADNFCRAATLTYPTDQKGNRISLRQRDLQDDSYTHMGISELEREIRGIGPSSAPTEEGAPVQQDLFAGVGDTEEDDIMRPAGDATIASTDYYYDKLMKSGFTGQNSSKDKAVPETVTETNAQRLARIDKGDIRDNDVIEEEGIIVLPVPSPRKVV